METTMKARLLIVNPEMSAGPPRVPTLILEDRVIGIYQEDRYWPIEVNSLEEISRENLEGVLHVRPTDVVVLSDIRTLPSDDLMSPEIISFGLSWWHETIEMWQKSQALPKAS
jgi:hypothetical protein